MRKDIGHWTLDLGPWALDIGRWTIIAAIGFYCSCQSNASEQPSLPDVKIARIMADLSIADAATTGLSGYAKDSLMHVYFKQVFEIHGITMETYEKDLRIIARDLPRMEVIVKQADELVTEGAKAAGSGLNH